jgi:hypothetical protein
MWTQVCMHESAHTDVFISMVCMLYIYQHMYVVICSSSPLLNLPEPQTSLVSEVEFFLQLLLLSLHLKVGQFNLSIGIVDRSAYNRGSGSGSGSRRCVSSL